MEHQDWHTITFNKVLKEQNKKEIDEKKLKLSTNLDYKLSKKEEEKGLKHDNVSQNISKIISIRSLKSELGSMSSISLGISKYRRIHYLIFTFE